MISARAHVCWLAAVASATAGLAPLCASAQSYPSRTIEVIVPFAAGGGSDIIARAVASAMSDDLGQRLVILNRDGAGGTLGFGALATAAPDGHTLAFSPSTPVTNAPYLVRGVKYGVESFDYVCQVFENVFAIAVRGASRFKSAQELFAAAREEAGLSYGHAGAGSIPHLSMANAADALKLKLRAVPFRGDAAILPVLLQGDLDFAAIALSSIREQQIRVLAVFADKRQPSAPDAPVLPELGVAENVPPGFNGLYAPKGLPPPVLMTLQGACAKAMGAEVVTRAIANTGQAVAFMDGEAFRKRIVADYVWKGQLVQRLGLKQE